MSIELYLVDLVMQCVSTVEFSYVINGRVYGGMIPTRGLRQGCPLSPFLFVICAQGFSSLIRSYENQGLFSGITMARHCPSVTNLFFADDSLVFFKASRQVAANFGDIIAKNGRASGQIINFEKSTILFSPNTTQRHMSEVTDTLGIRETNGHSLYLGLPTFIMKNKKLQFGYLKDKVAKKISSWDSKFFSSGGKEVLIKSVLQSLPTYAMSCFRIPVGTCEDIERSCSNFWWGDSKGKKKLHWAKWESLCEPKSRGGLGFRRLVPFNQALLAKQVWRIIQHPNSLLAKVLKQRYFKDGDIMEASISPNASYTWRSICWGRELLAKGLRWRVGNGASIKAYRDRWIPGFGKWDGEATDSLLVADMITTDRAWDKDFVLACFPEVVAESICSISLDKTATEDRRYWGFDERGRYSVKSGYLCGTNFYEPRAHTSSFFEVSWWKKIWALNVPPKVKHFAWRALHDYVASNGNLAAHHVPVLGFCSWCQQAWGSTEHALVWCEKVRGFWKESVFWEWIGQFKLLSLADLSQVVLDKGGAERLAEWFFMLWSIWRLLCSEKHGNKKDWGVADVRESSRRLGFFQKANEQLAIEGRVLPAEGVDFWYPPPRNVLRLDVDVAYQENGRRLGVGFIFRNDRGEIVAAGAQPVGFTETVLLGELHAMLIAVGVCLSLDLGLVVLFSDSLLAIHLLHDTYHGSDSLCDDLHEDFVHARETVVLEFLHVRREVNRAAHELARLALSFSDVMIWKSDFPIWLSNIALSDLN